jgi:hypothetical protein
MALTFSSVGHHGRTECGAGWGAPLELHDDARVLPECGEQPAQLFDGE